MIIHVDYGQSIQATVHYVRHGKGFTRGWIFWKGKRWVVADKQQGWVIERRYNWMVEYHRWFKGRYGWPTGTHAT